MEGLANHNLLDASILVEEVLLANTPVTAFNIAFVGYEGTATGDNYAWYTITWTSTSDAVMIKLAGRPAVGAGANGYGACYGAGDINGGPYHFKLDKLDSHTLGNRDNQVTVERTSSCTVDIPVTFGTPTATDTCDATPTIVVVNSDVVTTNTDGSKTHCRTWTATDDCNNTSTCSQCITVVCAAGVARGIVPNSATSKVVAEQAGFDAYPVPFKDLLTIRYQFDYKTAAKIEISDARGRLLMTYDDEDASYNKEVTLNPKFNQGDGQMFFIKVITNKGYTIKKIISKK